MLDLDGFRERTIVPPEDVNALEARREGFIARRLAYWSSLIEARLRKRYVVPFVAPVPDIVLGWLVDLVTVDVYNARGWNPSDEQAAEIVQAKTDALELLKEAADSETGLFDLPLRNDLPTSAIVADVPFGYSEQDPYTAFDRQAEVFRGR